MTDSAPEKRTRRRNRRRGAPQDRLDRSIASPCVSHCQLDDRIGLCAGCYRDIDEIRDWPIMTAQEKLVVLARVAERKSRGDP